MEYGCGVADNRLMRLIRLVVVRVGAEPEVADLHHRRDAFYELVGGPFLCTPIAKTIRGSVHVVSCMEAATKQLPLSRCGILGPFFFVVQKSYTGDWRGLSDEEIRKAFAWIELHKNDV